MVDFLLPPRLTGREKLLAEGMFTLKENPGTGLCLVRGCRRKHKDPRKVGGILLCSCHWQARWRARNPKQAAYATLRDHAKGRRIPFTLSLARFIQITDAAGFWDQDAETHGDRLSIDREDVTLGYSDTNIQVLTVSENVIKGNKERYLSPEVQAILARRRGVPETPWQMDEGRSWLDEPDPF